MLGLGTENLSEKSSGPKGNLGASEMEHLLACQITDRICRAAHIERALQAVVVELSRALEVPQVSIEPGIKTPREEYKTMEPSVSNATSVSRWDSYARRNDPSRLLVRLLFHDVLYRSCANLLRVAVFSEPISILELGCGPGYIARRITERVPTRKLVVVDSNPTMIELSKRVLRGLDCDVEFLEADFFQMDVSEEFDLVYSNGVVEHFDTATRARLLGIHADHVGHGGYCIIHVPTPTLFYRLFRALSRQMGCWEHEDETPLSLEQLLREVTQTGLEVLKVNYFWRYYLSEVGVIARQSLRRAFDGGYQDVQVGEEIVVQ